jgi:prepilin peptidase CpaA
MTAFFSGTVAREPALLLLAVAIVCALTDLKRGRIYNAVTYPAALAGFALQFSLYGTTGALSSLGGFAVGFVPAFLLFTVGGMGGGDVKLLGAVGAIAGAVAAAETLILAFLFGGLFALFKLAWRGRLLRTLGRPLRVAAGWVVPGVTPAEPWDAPSLTVPFGAAIALGALATLWDLHTGSLLGLF